MGLTLGDFSLTSDGIMTLHNLQIGFYRLPEPVLTMLALLMIHSGTPNRGTAVFPLLFLLSDMQ